MIMYYNLEDKRHYRRQGNFLSPLPEVEEAVLDFGEWFNAEARSASWVFRGFFDWKDFEGVSWMSMATLREEYPDASYVVWDMGLPGFCFIRRAHLTTPYQFFLVPINSSLLDSMF